MFEDGHLQVKEYNGRIRWGFLYKQQMRAIEKLE